jgi:hypothetical protein
MANRQYSPRFTEVQRVAAHAWLLLQTSSTATELEQTPESPAAIETKRSPAAERD